MAKIHARPSAQTTTQPPVEENLSKEAVSEETVASTSQGEENAQSEADAVSQEASQEEKASIQEDQSKTEEPSSEEIKEEVANVHQTADTPASTQVAPAKTQEIQAESKPEVSEAQAYLDEIRLNGTDVAKRILNAVETFKESLRPRAPLSDTEGYRIQKEFLDHMLWLLDRDYEDFAKGWSVLLVYFLEHHGNTNTPDKYSALSEYNVCRYRHAWQDGDRLEAYTNLITVIRATRNRNTMAQDVARIDLSKISPSLVSGKRLDNLNRYYKK